MSRSRAALEATAHHEAGHAVAAMHYGRRFRHVTIKQDADFLGHVLYEKAMRLNYDEALSPKRERALLDTATIALAGPAAAGAHRGTRSGFDFRGGTADREHATDAVLAISGSTDELKHWIAIARLRARGIVETQRELVSLVAAALLDRETLTWEEVSGLPLARVSTVRDDSQSQRALDRLG